MGYRVLFGRWLCAGFGKRETRSGRSSGQQWPELWRRRRWCSSDRQGEKRGKEGGAGLHVVVGKREMGTAAGLVVATAVAGSREKRER
ncbi:hypothetical protein HAX54_003147, partial [Datura stramonium]|nr:hypothetical protein [Datura stramonium]